jgi:D-glycero-alpha-D-manno-heptose-7-phosphate kinase
MPSQTVTAARARGTTTFDSARNQTASVRSRAPLRLGLAGGGTDVSPYCDTFGGVVLNATIDRYCYATVEQRHDSEAVFRAADLDIEDHLDSGCNKLELHAAVYRRMCHDFDLGAPPLTVTTVAEAPPGSGLGSSSTLVVSIVEAFREYFSLPLGEYDVARLAYSIEREDCLLQGGRQDQYAATFGGFNVMEFNADNRVIVNPLRLKPAIVHELEASLVVFHTGVRRDSAGIIHEQVEHVLSGAESRIEATHELRREAIGMKEALLMGDLHGLAEIMERGWNAKKQLADGISNPMIEGVFDVALGAGALAGKVSGAGGGGYVIFLVDPPTRPRVVAALTELTEHSVAPIHFVSDGAVAWTVQ